MGYVSTDKARFTPAEVATFTDWTVDGLRDMRAKGLLANYGTQSDSGRWKYSALDVVAFWVASQMQEYMRFEGRVSLMDAFASARSGAAVVRGLLQEGNGGRFSRYSAAAFVASGNGGSPKARLVTISDIADLSNETFHVCRVVDWMQFVESLPPNIRTLILPEVEEAGQ